jgi:hypothetical protein
MRVFVDGASVWRQVLRAAAGTQAAALSDAASTTVTGARAAAVAPEGARA